MVSFDEVISPKTKKVIQNEGMPIEGTSKKGKLILKFQVVFPKYLPQDKKDVLVEILS
jgi:DnaJ-class molecular chaperone